MSSQIEPGPSKAPLKSVNAHLIALGAALVVAMFVGTCEAAFVAAIGWGLGGVLHLPPVLDFALIVILLVPAL